jgi:uncharacterized protein YkwD
MKREMILISMTTAMLLLSGCGGSSDTTTDTTNGTPAFNGILTDAPVEGVTYTCGKIRQETGKNGTFSCDTTPVAFHVGGVKIGEVLQLPEDRYVTPQDLVGVPRDTYNENVTKIAVFLQSLDDDGEMESSINLDEALVEKLEEQELQLQQMSQTSMIELLDQIGAVDVVSQDDALQHLQRHMESLTVVPKMPEHGNINEDQGKEEIPQTIPEKSVPEELTPETVPEEQDPVAEIIDNIPLKTTPPPESSPDTTSTPKVTVKIPQKEENTSEEETKSDTQKPETVESKDSVPVPENDLKQAYLNVINETRSEGRECGEYGYFAAADPVEWSDKLYAASYEHSRDMAISNTFSHTGSGTSSDATAETMHSGEGSSVSERIEYNGYTNWRRYGENIAAGTSMDEAIEAMEGWLASPGHCKNIMKAEFKEVGMAVFYHEDSHYKYYWTQDFGTR